MKKLNLLIGVFALLTIFSCSSDDNDSSNPNSIIGEWKLIRSLEFENGELTEFIEGNCVQQSRERFFEDGTYNFIYYGLPQGDCIVEYQSTSGNWTIENGMYNINYEVEYYDGSTQEQNIPEIRVEGDLMYYRYTELIENGQVIEYYEREFERID